MVVTLLPTVTFVTVALFRKAAEAMEVTLKGEPFRVTVFGMMTDFAPFFGALKAKVLVPVTRYLLPEAWVRV